MTGELSGVSMRIARKARRGAEMALVNQPVHTAPPWSPHR
jgi:hypothetical protein